MATLRDVQLTVTTDGAGVAQFDCPKAIYGWLYSIEWVFGSGTAGVDPTVTMQNTPSGAVKTLLAATNANADKWYQPRDDEHGSDGVATGSKCYMLLNGTPRLTIAQGGSGKVYKAVLHYFE